MSKGVNDNQSKGVSDDLIQPFELKKTNFRGRIVRLEQSLNEILDAHQYPYLVSKLLAEALSLTCVLGGMLKYDGIFTLQISGKGAIRTLVCDITTEGHLRGYAGYNEDEIEDLEALEKELSLADLCGTGYLAFTVDQKLAERYQGIVELQDASLRETVLHYFEQSEQIQTEIMVSAEQRANRQWIAGALMLQKMPEDAKNNHSHKEDWKRSKILLNSCKDEELLDSRLVVNELLYRLFNEEGVLVFSPTGLEPKCRCSEDKVFDVLTTLSEDDLDHAEKKGEIEMVCEFCSRRYSFTKQDVLDKKK